MDESERLTGEEAQRRTQSMIEMLSLITGEEMRELVGVAKVNRRDRDDEGLRFFLSGTPTFLCQATEYMFEQIMLHDKGLARYLARRIAVLAIERDPSKVNMKNVDVTIELNDPREQVAVREINRGGAV